MRRRPLVAIVGATATGKSALAIEIARRFDGEVVNADAYSLYRGMDIGTAKVSLAGRRHVPHHLIDVTKPDKPLSLRRYLDLATEVLEDIWSRSKLAVLAGGSGQYVWALLEGWQVPRVAPDARLRAELEAVAAAKGTEALVARLAEIDPEAANRLDPQNSRRLIRAIEVVTASGQPLAACRIRKPLDAELLIIGLNRSREEHYAALDLRVQAQFDNGLLQEVAALRQQGYGSSAPVRSAIAYKELSAHLDGEYSLEEALKRSQHATHRLVRRQAAWFREDDPRIHWLPAGGECADEALLLAGAWLKHA